MLDTLQMARRMHPGQRNGLDALCKRYPVDNSQRDLHGALLDAELLLEVYLAMSGGQGALGLDSGEQATATTAKAKRAKRPRGALVVRRANEDEAAAHELRLASLDKASGGKTLWRTIEPGIMNTTLAQAFARNFLGHAPSWFKQAVIAFLVLNPLLLVTLGPVFDRAG